MCSIMKIIYFKKLFEEGDENSIDLTNIDDLMTSFNEFIIKQMELWMNLHLKIMPFYIVFMAEMWIFQIMYNYLLLIAEFDTQAICFYKLIKVLYFSYKLVYYILNF